MGLAPETADPDHYAFEYAHCDVLVAGSGPAGLAAALAAARAGARVVLADERAELGGSALWERNTIAGMPAADWVRAGRAGRLPQRALPAAQHRVQGHYDHGMVAIAERVTDHLAEAPATHPRQRLIHLRTKRVVMATGSIERPLVFADNDKAGRDARFGGAHLHQPVRGAAGTARRDLHQQRRCVPDRVRRAERRRQRSHDHRYAQRSRSGAGGQDCRGRHRALGRRVRRGGQRPQRRVGRGRSPRRRAAGANRVRRAGVLGRLEPDGGLLLAGRRQAPLRRGDHRLRPGHRAGGNRRGGRGGRRVLAGVLQQAGAAGEEAARLAGFAPKAGAAAIVPACEPETPPRIEPLWQAPGSASRGKRFVDIQDDVAVEDIELAHRENFRSVEHLKRYTTLGMGTDQGKTSNINGLAILASLRGETIPAVGTTTFRPPYTPVALGLFAGAERAKHHTPVRRTPLHNWHMLRGAALTTVGHWLRPKAYQLLDETFDAAWRRESVAVRNAVGLVDVGTLGDHRRAGAGCAGVTAARLLQQFREPRRGPAARADAARGRRR